MISALRTMEQIHFRQLYIYFKDSFDDGFSKKSKNRDTHVNCANL